MKSCGSGSVSALEFSYGRSRKAGWSLTGVGRGISACQVPTQKSPHRTAAARLCRDQQHSPPTGWALSLERQQCNTKQSNMLIIKPACSGGGGGREFNDAVAVRARLCERANETYLWLGALFLQMFFQRHHKATLLRQKFKN